MSVRGAQAVTPTRNDTNRAAESEEARAIGPQSWESLVADLLVRVAPAGQDDRSNTASCRRTPRRARGWSAGPSVSSPTRWGSLPDWGSASAASPATAAMMSSARRQRRAERDDRVPGSAAHQVSCGAPRRSWRRGRGSSGPRRHPRAPAGSSHRPVGWPHPMPPRAWGTDRRRPPTGRG